MKSRPVSTRGYCLMNEQHSKFTNTLFHKIHQVPKIESMACTNDNARQAAHCAMISLHQVDSKMLSLKCQEQLLYITLHGSLHSSTNAAEDLLCHRKRNILKYRYDNYLGLICR